MKRSPVLVFVVLALLLTGCLSGTGGFGNISVTSDPPGARVFLDGKDTGLKTPAVLERVSVGRHEITVELAGYKSQTRAVTVSRSSTVTVSFSLTQDAPPVDPTAARVSGYVSENNGGRRLPGATVTAYEAVTGVAVASTVTDPHGAYELYIPAGTYDIIAGKAGHAQGKRQSLAVGPAERARADLIAKRLRDPSKGASAPTIHVYLEEVGEDGGIVRAPFEPGTVIPQGALVFGVIEVEADYDVYSTQVWIGHRGYDEDFVGEILENETSFFLWDLFDAPGDTELVVAAYDWQENWTEVRIPFTYDIGEPSVFLHPVDFVGLAAVTFGHDLGFYRVRRADIYEQLGIPGQLDLLQLPNGHFIDVSRLDKDVTMFVEITWSDVFGAAGYEIERAYHQDGPWERIAKVGSWYGTSYIDLSPELAPGVPFHYRVRAVGPNDEKGGWSSPVWVTPLDRFAILLVDPADDATNVSLTPTFRWRYDDIGADEYIYDIFVAGVTGVPGGESDYFAWYYEGLVNETEVEYNFDGTGLDLAPGKTYQWNIIEGQAVAYYRPNSVALAFPWTGLDDYAGAANGEFVFTTVFGH